MISYDLERPWLLDLATEQRGGSDRVEGVYDEESQMRVLPDSSVTAAIEYGMARMTKKADRESGEDQKERW
jgi:hypothetical protein